MVGEMFEDLGLRLLDYVISVVVALNGMRNPTNDDPTFDHAFLLHKMEIRSTQIQENALCQKRIPLTVPPTKTKDHVLVISTVSATIFLVGQSST